MIWIIFLGSNLRKNILTRLNICSGDLIKQIEAKNDLNIQSKFA